MEQCKGSGHLCMCGLGAVERAILEMQAQRLRWGQQNIGVLNLRSDKRRWPLEALAEAIDINNYLAAEIIRIQDAVLETEGVKGTA